MQSAAVGHAVAVDLEKGKIRRQIPLGSMENFGGAHGAIPNGPINLGALIVTASGLVFIAGTTDPHFRAFDIGTGKERWKA